MTTNADREKAKKGIRARQNALKTLIERHQTEFDELHAKFRVDEGLPPRSAGPSRAELEDRIRKQRERLEKWERELRLVS